ncbi:MULTISPECIES: helix-turn-helix transcriptional regulator [unclassified Mesorhizobium]|uniref:helix-turn-helix transcriptional regulator n=1 Tax=unclassified Mesorhizobium TaxID=325217 RepID=UPI000FC9FD0B|nr:MULTISPECIES: helix-turn-helix transcriptional regulator [unclassified Mesorhizobium]RUW98603.1 LuxR family transcriptional regulator [Mesorhizobium sp. M8A.F.Ca.ET.023.01.1.1]RVD49252.1 LuxR family transcriptional regulator [Mesorhizobium sp. M8A.F.Ca.ET.023.02.2.1]TGR43583.1 LuxR family transcriptional regulator [bacterium M00.F.Ca.ET.199.01.1.1]TGU39930.1 LuxR family transcriptional regulator [bacterium M00.F.Ca.ET.156.01.1.1]TGU99691.1 LuxR family transcriptional regulator [Mesorhizobiu
MIGHAENLQRLSEFAEELSASRNERNTDTDTSSFVVNGHSLVAIRHLEDEEPGGPSGHGDQRPVGRIVCAGTHYLIYDAVYVPATADTPLTAADILTRRELQIALLIAEGKLDKEIARQLGISGYTVREHIRRIFAKLNIGRRSAIASCVLPGWTDFRHDVR